jgi:hypothetical protein
MYRGIPKTPRVPTISHLQPSTRHTAFHASVEGVAQRSKHTIEVNLARVQLLDTHASLIQTTVQSRSDCQSTTNDGANTGKEAGEGFGASLLVDDLHG